MFNFSLYYIDFLVDVIQFKNWFLLSLIKLRRTIAKVIISMHGKVIRKFHSSRSYITTDYTGKDGE